MRLGSFAPEYLPSALHVREFEAGALLLQSRPQALFVELTLNCNLRCHMCRPGGPYLQTLDMPFDLYKRVADELFPTAQLVDLRGSGESTILPDFLKYVEYAARFGCQLKLNTNLTVRNDRLWESLIAHHFILAVSFDASQPATFERLRKGARYETIHDNLGRLARCCYTYSVPLDNIYFSVVVQEGNLSEMTGIMRIAHSFGFRRLKLFPIKCAAESPHNLLHYRERVRRMLDDVAALADDLGMVVELGASLHPDLVRKECVPSRCAHPWMYCYINYEGGIGFCDHLIGKPQFILGKLGEQSFDEIWNGAPAIQLRREHVEGSHSHEYEPCDWCYAYRYVDLEHLFYEPYEQLMVGNGRGKLYWNEQ